MAREGAGGTSLRAIQGLFHVAPSLFLGIAAMAWFMTDRKSASSDDEGPAGAPLPDNLKRFLAAYFLYNFALYGATSFLSIYLKSLHANSLWITGTFAAGVVCEAAVMRFSGRFSDRFGRRPALAFAFLMLPLRLFLYVPATAPIWVTLVQMLHGFNFGIVGVVAIAFANDVAADRTRGHAQARLAVVMSLASALGPITLGEIANAAGLRVMFAVAAVIALAGALIMLYGVEDSHPESESIADHGPRALRAVLRVFERPPGRS
jgi:MFS family permease